MIDINPTKAEKQLSVVKRYYPEILFILLIASIGYLYNARDKDHTIYESTRVELSNKIEAMNVEFRQYINVDRKEALRQNYEVSGILTDIKGVLLENQVYLKSKK